MTLIFPALVAVQPHVYVLFIHSYNIMCFILKISFSISDTNASMNFLLCHGTTPLASHQYCVPPPAMK